MRDLTQYKSVLQNLYNAMSESSFGQEEDLIALDAVISAISSDNTANILKLLEAHNTANQKLNDALLSTIKHHLFGTTDKVKEGIPETAAIICGNLKETTAAAGEVAAQIATDFCIIHPSDTNWEEVTDNEPFCDWEEMAVWFAKGWMKSNK